VPRTLVRADEVIEQAVDFAALRPVAIGTLAPFVARHRVGRYWRDSGHKSTFRVGQLGRDWPQSRHRRWNFAV